MRNLALVLAFAFLLPVCLALAAPAITSPSHPNQDAWYNSGSIIFTWAAVGADDGTTEYYYLLDHETETIPDATAQHTSATKIETQDKMDGIWYFHLRAKRGTEWSDAAHYKVQIDKVKPSPVKGATATATGKDELTLSWLPATDNSSGIDGYIIFKSRVTITDVRDSTVSILQKNFKGTEVKDEGLLKGITYHYVIAANDNAGNRGPVSREFFAESMKYCSATVTLTHAWDRQANTLSVNAESSDALRYASLRLTAPDGNETVLETKNNATELSGSYALSQSKKGIIKITLAAKDASFDPCDKTETFYYDPDAPKVSLISPAGPAELSDSVQLKASAEDSGEFISGIESVSFYYANSKGGWAEITKLPASESGTYTYDWNTATSPNGRFLLKVVAADTAGNSAETEPLAVTIKNLYRARAEAASEIESANSGKKTAEQAAATLKSEMVSAPLFGELVKQADANLSAANSVFDKGVNYEGAKARAEAAAALYSRAANLVKITPYRSKTYAFTIGNLPTLLRSSGLREDLAKQAEPLIKKYSVSRKLEIVEVRGAEDRNAAYYQARVIVTIKNSDRNALDIQIAEFVPKEFTKNASELTSATEFGVLRADPIINFRNLKVPFGQTLTLSYSLKSRFSRTEADKFIKENVVSKFPAPPVVLASAAGLDSSAFSVQFGTLIPNLGSGTGANQQLLIFGLAAAVVIILLLIAAVLAAVIFFFLLRRRKR